VLVIETGISGLHVDQKVGIGQPIYDKQMHKPTNKQHAAMGCDWYDFTTTTGYGVPVMWQDIEKAYKATTANNEEQDKEDEKVKLSILVEWLLAKTSEVQGLKISTSAVIMLFLLCEDSLIPAEEAFASLVHMR
jgi:hypothetical protein